MSAATSRPAPGSPALPPGASPELWRLELCEAHTRACVAFGARDVGPLAELQRVECALCSAPPARIVSIPRSTLTPRRTP